MTSIAAGRPHPYASERQVQVVADDYKVALVYVQFVKIITYCIAAQVHIGRRLEKMELPSLERNRAQISIALRDKNGIGCLSPGIQYYKSGVVSGLRVFGSYVAETYDQEILFRHSSLL